MCRCPLALSNGAVPSSGGGDASLFSVDVQTVGAVTVVVPLASLAIVGADAMLRAIAVRSVERGTPGGFSQINFAGATLALRNVADGSQRNGPPPWGPPAGVPPMNSTGYQPPLVYGSPGGIATTIRMTGNQLEIAITGIAAFTIDHSIRGNLYVFDGAVRLVA